MDRERGHLFAVSCLENSRETRKQHELYYREVAGNQGDAQVHLNLNSARFIEV